MVAVPKALARMVSSTAGSLDSAAPQPEPTPITKDEESPFRAADLEYDLAPSEGHLNLEDLKFGTVFTDHMFTVEHVAGEGWSRPRIGPFQNIPVHPAAPVLHYGMCCFEGMKAYVDAAGRVRLFRPEMNMARLARSAARLELAPFDQGEMLACLKAFLRVDAAWVPRREGHSLYLRPFAFSTSHTLGVAKSTRTMLSVIASPVGPYFPSGLVPIPLFVDEVNRRAWPGGVGHAKVGANYAPTIAPQVAAAGRYGTPQVVYTFAAPDADPEDAVFEECGAMNVMFLLDDGAGGRELVTPPLKGTILPGVTRDSILTLTREAGEVRVAERDLSIRELREAAAAGRLIEAFGCGTACIVQPIASFVRANGDVMRTVGDGSFTNNIFKTLSDIQYGRVEHPWSEVV